MAELTLNHQNFEQEVIKSDKPVLVDFWKPGCGPCITIKPIIEEIAQEFEGKAKVGRLNVAQNPQIAKNYKIMAVPTLIIFKDGEPKERAVGLRSKQVIADKLKSLV